MNLKILYAFLFLLFFSNVIFISIPNSFHEVEPGEDILTNVKLINLGSGGRIDVILEFNIRDIDEKSILTKKETVAVETQANFVRYFTIPKDTPPGKYTVYVKLIYADGKEAVAGTSFYVIEKPQGMEQIYLFILGIIGFILMIYVLFKFKVKSIIDNIKLKNKIIRIINKKIKK